MVSIRSDGSSGGFQCLATTPRGQSPQTALMNGHGFRDCNRGSDTKVLATKGRSHAPPKTPQKKGKGKANTATNSQLVDNEGGVEVMTETKIYFQSEEIGRGKTLTRAKTPARSLGRTLVEGKTPSTSGRTPGRVKSAKVSAKKTPMRLTKP